MEWTEFLTNIALSSATAALITGVFEYIFENRQFKRQARVEYIRTRAILYSLILFYLEKMRLTGVALGKGDDHYLFKQGEIDDIIKELNQEIKDKIYLLDPEALKNWLELQPIIYQEAC